MGTGFGYSKQIMDTSPGAIGHRPEYLEDRAADRPAQPAPEAAR